MRLAQARQMNQMTNGTATRMARVISSLSNRRSVEPLVEGVQDAGRGSQMTRSAWVMA